MVGAIYTISALGKSGANSPAGFCHNPPHANTAGAVYAIGPAGDHPENSRRNFMISTVKAADGQSIHVGVQMYERQSSGEAITATILAVRSLDPGSASFSLMDSGNSPIMFATLTGQAVNYARFNISTNAWVTLSAGIVFTEVDFATKTGDLSGGFSAAFIQERSDGDLIFQYQGFRSKVMGNDRASVGIKNSTDGGVTWSARQDGDENVDVDARANGFVIPPLNSDVGHVFWSEASVQWQRPYSAADVLGTANSAQALPSGGSTIWMWPYGLSISSQPKVIGQRYNPGNVLIDFRFTGYTDDRSWSAASKIAMIAGSITGSSQPRWTQLLRDNVNTEMLLVWKEGTLSAAESVNSIRWQALPDDASPYEYEFASNASLTGWPVGVSSVPANSRFFDANYYTRGATRLIGITFVSQTLGNDLLLAEFTLPAGGATTITRTASLDSLLQRQDNLRTSALDALLQRQGIVRTADLDAVLAREFQRTAGVDARLRKTLLATTQIDSLLQRQGLTRDANVDALLQKTLTLTAQADALLKREGLLRTADLDAVLSGTAEITAQLDGLLQKTLTRTGEVDAILSRVFSLTSQLDAVFQKTLTQTVNVDSLLKRIGLTRTGVVDALLQRQDNIVTAQVDALLKRENITREAFVDALLQKQGLTTVAVLDALLQRQGITTTAVVDAILEAAPGGVTRSASIDALLQRQGIIRTGEVDAVLVRTLDVVASVDALLQRQGLVRTAQIDGLLQRTLETTAQLDSLLQRQGNLRTAQVDTVLQKAFLLTGSVDAVLQNQGLTVTANLDGLLQRIGQTRTADLDALLARTFTTTANLDAVLQNQGLTLTALLDGLLQKTLTATADVDAVLTRPVNARTALLDAFLQRQGILRVANLDAILSGTVPLTVLLDSVLVRQALLTASVDALIFQNITIGASIDAVLVKSWVAKPDPTEPSWVPKVDGGPVTWTPQPDANF